MRRVAAGWLICWTLALGARGDNIRRIEIRGIEKVSEAAVRRDLPVQQGEPFEPAQLDAARDYLLGLGFFLEVQATSRTEGAAVDLQFVVVENPTVQRVQFEGNTVIASAALREVLATRPGEILSMLAVRADATHIGRIYTERGLFVNVEPQAAPQPLRHDQPVTLTFQMAELKLGAARCQPLGYLRAETVSRLFNLEPGALLRRGELVGQQQRLFETGLFKGVDEPQTVDTPQPDVVDLVYPVALADRPVLTAETLPLVDLPRLARAARLGAVDITLTADDLLPAVPVEELARRRGAARAALETGTPRQRANAAADLFAATRGAGRPAGDEAAMAAERLGALADRNADEQLRLGSALAYLGRADEAVAPLTAALDDTGLRLDAAAELVNVHAARVRTGGEAAMADLTAVVDLGCAACLALPAEPSLAQLTAGVRFFYNALGVSPLGPGLAAKVSLDGPVCRRLMSAVQPLVAGEPGDEAIRHIGKLVTAVAFLGVNLPRDGAGERAWTEFRLLLTPTRDVLLSAGLEGSADREGWFFAALCDLLRGTGGTCRVTAFAGLAEESDNEPLIDLLVISALEGPLTGLDGGQSAELLARLAGDPAEPRPALSGWGAELLQAKLALALRDALPAEATAERETARQTAEAAANRAAELRPDHPSAWWLLALARLKSSEPLTASTAWDRLNTIDPQYRDAAYLRALLLLLRGETEAGLAAMAPAAG